MRNLNEYPITLEEWIETLRSVSKELDKQEICGDIRPIILNQVADYLMILDAFVNNKKN